MFWKLMSVSALSGVYTGEKAVAYCQCCWKLQFGEMVKFLLKLHHWVIWSLCLLSLYCHSPQGTHTEGLVHLVSLLG